jgi:hypothetical protein
MTAKTNPVSRQSDLVVQEATGELLIYDLKNNRALCLNETTTAVYQLCDGTNSINDLSRQLSRKLNSSVTEELVWLALDQLQRENLLATVIEKPAAFAGLSRREVIRRIGTATLVALPFITALIAPTAARAGSVSETCDTSCICSVANADQNNSQFCDLQLGGTSDCTTQIGGCDCRVNPDSSFGTCDTVGV